MRGVIAAICLVSLVLIPGSAFVYWVPDSYGQEIGPGLPGPQGGYLSGLPGLPWLGNILSGIFGNPGYAYNKQSTYYYHDVTSHRLLYCLCRVIFYIN